MLGRLGHISPVRSWLLGFKDSEAREAMEALDRVNMAQFAARMLAGSLSGGEMQRVSIARAIHQRPLIYLADEPISSLDPKNADAIMSILQPLSRETPVIGAFHQPATVARYCTRVIGIRSGEIVYDGSAQISAAHLESIYGGSCDENRPSRSTLPPFFDPALQPVLHQGVSGIDGRVEHQSPLTWNCPSSNGSAALRDNAGSR